MTEPATPALSAPQTRDDILRLYHNDRLTHELVHLLADEIARRRTARKDSEITRLELESSARQRVIDAIERECENWRCFEADELASRILAIVAIIADGEEGK